jgi:cytochrome c oxidase cbb3-type subunit 3
MLTSTDSPARRQIPRFLAVAAILSITVAGFAYGMRIHRDRLYVRLLEADSVELLKDPQLTAFAASEGKPLFAAHCASCHGQDLRGDPKIGAPNLVDSVWLYQQGSVFDIERTVLYGARSGMSKSRNVTDMPPFGLTGRLSDAEIRNLVQYVLQLSGRPHQTQAAIDGHALYLNAAKANCGDCHGENGRGNPDYGAPNLTRDVWNSGGQPEDLYRAIYSGQHRVMPGFYGTLSLEQIRALSVYVYLESHRG